LIRQTKTCIGIKRGTVSAADDIVLKHNEVHERVTAVLWYETIWYNDRDFKWESMRKYLQDYSRHEYLSYNDYWLNGTMQSVLEKGGVLNAGQKKDSRLFES
jgi:hypothetical protein